MASRSSALLCSSPSLPPPRSSCKRGERVKGWGERGASPSSLSLSLFSFCPSPPRLVPPAHHPHIRSLDAAPSLPLPFPFPQPGCCIAKHTLTNANRPFLSLSPSLFLFTSTLAQRGTSAETLPAVEALRHLVLLLLGFALFLLFCRARLWFCGLLKVPSLPFPPSRPPPHSHAQWYLSTQTTANEKTSSAKATRKTRTYFPDPKKKTATDDPPHQK